LLWKFAPNCCTLLAVRCSFGRAGANIWDVIIVTVNSYDFILGSIPKGGCIGTVSPNMPVKAAKATFTLKARPLRWSVGTRRSRPRKKGRWGRLPVH
jgi:hypothetical protein